jgi:hypothetical protein
VIEESRVQTGEILSESGASRRKLRVRNNQESCGSVGQSGSIARFYESVAIVASRPTALTCGLYWANAQGNEGRCWIAPHRCWFRAKIAYRFVHLIASFGNRKVTAGGFTIIDLTEARGRPSASAPHAIAEERPQTQVNAAAASISWCFPQMQVNT